MNILRRILITCLPLAALAACGGGDTEDRLDVRDPVVRFIHAAPDAPELTLYRGDVAQGDATGTSYQFGSDYFDVSMADADWSVKTAAGNTSLGSVTIDPERGTRYTIVALPGKDGGGRMTILTDDVVPTQGKARLRVVNAAPILTDLTVKIEGRKEPVFKNVDYGSGTSFSELDPASVVIVFGRDDPPGTVLRMPRLRLEAGRSYTIVLAGAASGTLKPITVTDAIRTYAVR